MGLRVWMLVGLTAVAQNRPIGSGVNLYSREKEAALGKQLAEEVRRGSRVLGSQTAQAYVERVGRELGAQLPSAGFAYTFEVLAEQGDSVREPVALPGGYVFIPAGLFIAAESEAEFAGMLAHAMVHAAARHGTRLATRGEIVNANATPLIFMGTWGGLHGDEAALPLGFRAFARAYELEADRMAVHTMAQAGYDPAALVRYIERMQPGDGSQLRSVRSPLPSRETRLAELKEAIASLSPREYGPGGDEFERVRDEVRKLTGDAPPAPSLRRRHPQGI